MAQDLPRNLWELLLPHTEVTLNLIWQATLGPSRSDWAYFHGPFNYDATPLGSLDVTLSPKRRQIKETRGTYVAQPVGM